MIVGNEEPDKFEQRWPYLWGLLNRQARQNLPPGLAEYLSGEWCETGETHLDCANAAVGFLISRAGEQCVGDAYRRDFSGVGTTHQLEELLCEITDCAALASIAQRVEPRPKIQGQETRPDVLAVIAGIEVYCEVKRFEDSGPGPQGRALVRRPRGDRTQGTVGPRSMALRAKLEGVPDQLPGGTVNLVFVHHRSFGESQEYIQQALFGDMAFGADPGSATITCNGALFARATWRKVSAVAYVRIDPTDCAFRCLELWRNPEASVPLPDTVEQEFRRHGVA